MAAVSYPGASIVGRRYSTRNFFALQELAAWLEKHEPELAGEVHAGETYEWCEAWLDNDPRNGGDPWQRRQMRSGWPEGRDEFFAELAKHQRWFEVRERARIHVKLAIGKSRLGP